MVVPGGEITSVELLAAKTEQRRATSPEPECDTPAELAAKT